MKKRKRAYSSGNILALACESRIGDFGFCFAGFGLHGETSLSLSNQRPLSLGTGCYRLFWRLRSRPKSLGRPKIDAEIRAFILRMVEENPTWDAPRIHGELVKLGFDVSERAVSRYLTL